MAEEYPLFPLKTVLLPGNTLALKIFEPRYLDMVAACLRENSEFGIVLIYRGDETGVGADIYSIGTTARICDWENRADGLLSISVEGVDRFEIVSTRTEANGLLYAEIERLDDGEASAEVPDQFYYMRELLEHISTQADKPTEESWTFSEVLYRLIYLLPLETNLKQRLLEIDDGNDRATILHAELIRLGVIQYVKPEAANE